MHASVSCQRTTVENTMPATTSSTAVVRFTYMTLSACLLFCARCREYWDTVDEVETHPCQPAYKIAARLERKVFTVLQSCPLQADGWTVDGLRLVAERSVDVSGDLEKAYDMVFSVARSRHSSSNEVLSMTRDALVEAVGSESL